MPITPTNSNDAENQDSHDEDVRLITQWLEDELGCSEVELHRQRRWRPIWHASMIRNGVPTKMFMKGDRTWPTHPYPLDYEMHIQQTLYDNDIPIPAILGMCPNPKTMVMEWVDGGRDPGLIQEAIENKSEMTDDRWQASLRYMELLADMHRILPENFVAAGADMPNNPEQLALGNFERFHAMTDQVGISDPMIEFGSRWLRRNVPQNRSTVSFLTGDCGQFLADGPTVTCVMDVEIGHLGDNMHDLSCFRGRHPIENMGDVPALFRHYEEAYGQPLDFDSIAFHTVSFLLEAYYGPLFGLHETGRGGDWVEGAVQVAIIGRRCMEALAEVIGLELEELTLPEPEETYFEDLALNKLLADINRLPLSESLQKWQRSIMASVPLYLRNRGHYRHWCEREDLADIIEVIGEPANNLSQANSKLTDFIKQAGPDQDAAFTRLFHRQMLRHCLIIAGPNPATDHIALAKIEPILHLKK
jgi:hypothetical protein